MSSIGTLWAPAPNFGGKRIRAIVALAGLQLDSPAEYTHYVDNLKPPFLSKFPHGKVPALETKDGFCLFEGASIARYVASLNPNVHLLGSTPEEQALVDQWTNFTDTEIRPPTGFLSQLFSHKIPYSKPLHTSFVERIFRSFNTIEKVLATRTFLVGERITLADISVAAAVQGAASFTLDPVTRTTYPSLLRHTETVLNQPTIKAIYGPIEYPEKVATYTPPPKEVKKEVKKKEEKPKAEKVDKPKEAPKKEVEQDEEDDDLVPKEEPKAKNPLEFLAKSTFNLEDWKRTYSNKDTRGPGGAIEWFYQNFDKEGFSIWRCDFKYNEELTLVFMSSNQIGGFFNRLEGSRKYLFGSMGVLGTANDSIISGVFITRGDSIKATVDAAPDWESYDYKKIDLENEEQKKFFEAALAWDLEIDGKKWADGKNFK